MTIYSSTYPSVPLLHCSTFSHVFPDHDVLLSEKTAFVEEPSGASATRGEIKRDALRFAYGLRERLTLLGSTNLKEGDIMHVLSPNCLLYPSVILGAIAAGIRPACGGAAQSAKELAHQIQITRPSLYIVHPSIFEVLFEAMRASGYDTSEVKRRVVLLAKRASVPRDLIKQGWTTFEDITSHNITWRPIPFDDARASVTATIFYSSGTTSFPKAIEISHLALNSGLRMMQNWGGLRAPTDVLLSPFPFYHVTGYCLLSLLPLLLGVPSVFFSKFDFENCITCVERYKATLLIVPPVVLSGLATHPIIAKTNFTTLKGILTGAAPVPEPLLSAAYLRLKGLSAPGFSIVQGFGLSEATGVAHITPFGRVDKPASIGKLHANIQARLVTDDGLDVPVGEPGELWVRGPVVMNGYLNAPDATRESITSNGWLKTGDIARCDDDGWWYIVDRKKELIKYHGYQVPPAELESILSSHPLIADSGVIGVLSADGSTELPRAYIVAKNPAHKIDPQFPALVQAWVKGKVTYYKELRGGVRIIDSIPRSAAGKILRRELRELDKREASQLHTGVQVRPVESAKL